MAPGPSNSRAAATEFGHECALPRFHPLAFDLSPCTGGPHSSQRHASHSRGALHVLPGSQEVKQEVAQEVPGFESVPTSWDYFKKSKNVLACQEKSARFGTRRRAPVRAPRRPLNRPSWRLWRWANAVSSQPASASRGPPPSASKCRTPGPCSSPPPQGRPSERSARHPSNRR